MFFRNLYQPLCKFLEEEYHNLDLWYVASFIFGIVAYFSLTYEPSLSKISLLFISSFSLLYLRKFGLLGLFVSLTIIFFCAGIFVAKYRSNNIQVQSINRSAYLQMTGVVDNIKYTNWGVQVILIDIDVSKYKYNKKSEFEVVKENFNEIKFPSKVKLSAKQVQVKDILIGDKIKLEAFVSPAYANDLPGGYNFKLHAFFSEIGGSGYVIEENMLIKKVNTKSSNLYIDKLRGFVA